VKTIFDPNKYLEGGRFISSQVWHILLNNWKEMKASATTPMAEPSQNPTKEKVQLTGKLDGVKNQIASTT
jgi:hypothetical protein